ncbi:MAG: hypothetical protein ABI193_21740 [Minicystis sp.]
MNHRRILSLLAACLPCLVSCVGTTGSELFSFDAEASGPEDAELGQPLAFTTGRGYAVVLDRARVHVGAVYLNKAVPISGAQATSCVLPGIYVAQLTRGLVVDALSPEPQPFPDKGEALGEHALAGEVWLSGGDINALADDTVILDVAGTAAKDGITYPFEGALTIGQNRSTMVADPSQPGANPICRERIVSPIPVDLTPRESAKLRLRIDPRRFFSNVDFAALERVSESPPRYRFEDRTVGQPNINLYQGLRSREGTYQFSWND